MNHLLLAGAMALVLTTGAAVAQTTSSETTTIVTPAPAARPIPVAPLIVAPPPGTLSVTRTQQINAPDGSQTDKTETTYRNTNGVADDTTTKTITYPAPVAATTSTFSKTTTTSTP
jgi:hypothetical protein